jgi:hypothetical protein
MSVALFESNEAYIKVISNASSFTSTMPSTSISQRYAVSFHSWPEDHSVQEGYEIIFECMALNFLGNQLNYKWLKDGMPLDLDDPTKRMQLVQGKNLRIEKLHETDSGTYTCRICTSAGNPEGNEECDDRSGTLQVLMEPRFLKRPQSVNATIKSDVELECVASGIPAPNIEWFKNGEPIYPSDYFQFGPNRRSLRILGIIEQDEGYYQCLASNELNTIQTVAKLSVQDQKTASKSVSSVKIKKATSPAPKYPTNEGALFSTQPQLTSTESNIIHLSAPVNLRASKIRSRQIHLEWSPPPIVRNIQFPSQDKLQNDAYSNKKASLTDNDAANLYYLINWKAKNVERSREMNTSRTMMIIDELVPDTTYNIQVCSLVGTVKGPCAVLDTRTENEPFLPGPPLDFKAEFIDLTLPTFSLPTSNSVSTTPTVKFKWRKPLANPNNIVKYRLYYQHLHYGPINYNENANSNDKKKQQNFHPSENKQNLFNSDEEFYASNVDEDENMFSTFSHEETEEEENEQQNSVELSNEKYLDIEIPNSNGVANIESDFTASLPQSNEAYYEFLLEDLLKFSTYKFRLLAIDANIVAFEESNKHLNASSDYMDSSGYDEYLNGVHSGAELIVETPSDVPDGPPEEVTIDTINTTAILIYWKPPALDKRNGIIIGYKISVKENEKQLWNLNVDAEPKRKLIGNLSPSSKYSVRVTARTVNGTGPPSEWTIAETFSHEMDGELLFFFFI